MPDGTRIKNRGAFQWIIDANGNKIETNVSFAGTQTTTIFRDTQTEREIRCVFDSAVNSPYGQMRVEYQTVGGGWANILINYRSTTVNGWAYEIGDLYCSDKAEIISQNFTVLGSIVLPQTEPGVNRQFTFEYNSDTSVSARYQKPSPCTGQTLPSTMSKGLGSLSKMTTPTGAVVKYSYLNDQPDSGSTLTVPVNPTDLPGDALVKKEIEHDTGTDIWNYSPCIQSGISSMTGPDGSNVTEKSFPHDRAFQYTHGGADGKGGLTYRTAQKTSTGIEVVVVERKWRFNSLNGMPAGSTGSGQLTPFNPVVDIEFTTLMDPPGTSAKMSARQFQYDLNGNVIGETNYDWFDPSLANPYRDPQDGNVPSQVPPGVSVLRTTANTYYNSPGTDQNSPNIYARRLNSDSVSPLILNAPRTSVVGSSQSEFYYDGSLSLNASPLIGNLTKESHLESGSTWISTTHTYDALTGNRTSTTDPNGNVTQFFYDATQALPSSVVVDPLNGTGTQTTSTVYDFSTGLPLSVTDPNGRTTSSSYANHLLSGAVDPFNRPGTVTDPKGRTTVTRYRDNLRQVEVWSDLNTAGDAKLRSRTTADKLGRPTKSESSEDGATYAISADTHYPQMGKVTVTTNPARAQAAGTDGWTRVTKDDLGRVATVETFSGIYPSTTTPTGTVTTTYNGIATTVTDQANKMRRSIVDGLGRLIRVDEPNSAGSLGSVTAPNQPTSYSYDSLGNLTQVSQGGQIRSFVYNALSRLTQAINPESGTILYDYYHNGNLWHKTDARGIQTTFTYDGLNRVLTRSYSVASATPTVTYVYDTLGAGLNGKGRLTSVSSSVSSYSYGSYDELGRVLTGTQTTEGQNYSMSYEYNLAGGMKTETYPNGRVVTTNFDAVGRLSSVTGQKSGEPNKTYASQVSYTAHGAIASTTLGNNLVEGTTYNGRLQPTFIKLGTTSNPTSVLQLGYEYTSACQPGNNGNVMRQTIAASGLSLTQDYCYDSLNRLTSAIENSGANWSQTYGFDRWGNRWVSGSTGYGLSPLTPTSGAAFNTGNNRLNGSGYDFAGNQTTEAQGRSFEYDGENRQTKFKINLTTTGEYFYDGDGHRVKKIDDSGTTVFVYNASGQLISEYTSDPPTGSGTSYLTSDHLGSTRVVTKSDGTVKARYDYLPFGEQLGAGIGGRTIGMGYDAVDSTRQKFTQKERDNESGLDYFLARYYSSAQGRFTSPDEFKGGAHEIGVLGSGDPEKQALAYADITNPQSLNKYQYTFNNPLRYVDPDGQAPQDSFDNRINFRIRQQLRGEITEQQYWAALRGESVGAIAGLGVVGGVALGLRAPAIGLAILRWATQNPERVQQIASAIQEAGGGPPVVGTALNVNAVAKSLGFKAGFSATEGLVGGQLKNGGTVLANLAKAGDQLTVNVSIVAGGVKGTLKALEEGIQAAGKESGASTVRVIATGVTDRMKNYLTRKGFTEVVKDGKATGQWERVVGVQ